MKKDIFRIVNVSVIIILTILIVLVCIKGKDKNMNIDINNDFDYAFLKLNNNKKDIIYSPLSIKYALLMLKDAASGNTLEEIESVLGSNTASKYTNSDKVSLANAFFIKDIKKDNVKNEYVNLLKDNYNAEILFDSFKTPDKLNNWVSDKTFKLIPKLVDNISSSDYILVNALAIKLDFINKIQSDKEYSDFFAHENINYYIGGLNDSGTLYFGGAVNNYDIVKTIGKDNIKKKVSEEYKKWMKEYCEFFDCEKDVEKVVNNYIKELDSNYKTNKVSTDFSYYVDNDVKVLKKDLESDNNTNLEFIAIMPTNKDLDKFINELDTKYINNILSNIKEVDNSNHDNNVITVIKGSIPVFKYDYKVELKDNLVNLGIKDAFISGVANLSKGFNNDVYVDRVLHKATIDFSNTGIKAAAATAIMMRDSAMHMSNFDYLYDVPTKVVDLNFDKPFMYIIKDKNTNDIWFVGAFYNNK